MHKLILWLKRNFTVAILGVIISVLSLYLAYNRYLLDNGGNVATYISNHEIPNDKTFVICTTFDSVEIELPLIYHRFKNVSKYALKYSKVTYIVSQTPNKSGNFAKYYTSSKYNLDNSFYEYNDSSVQKKDIYSYKIGDFYQDDMTPLFLDSLMLIPKVFNSKENLKFNIVGKFYSNTHTPKVCTSHIYYCPIDDRDNHYIHWLENVLNATKGIIQADKEYDFILCYGNNTEHLYGINIENIDSIITMHDSHQFRLSHIYDFQREAVNPIKRIMPLLGGLFLVVVALIFIWKCKISNVYNAKYTHAFLLPIYIIVFCNILACFRSSGEVIIAWMNFLINFTLYYIFGKYIYLFINRKQIILIAKSSLTIFSIGVFIEVLVLFIFWTLT